jgi:hypothetical protein
MLGYLQQLGHQDWGHLRQQQQQQQQQEQQQEHHS